MRFELFTQNGIIADGLNIIRSGKSIIGKTDSIFHGWYSPTYGVKKPALSVQYSITDFLPIEITTRFSFLDNNHKMHILLIHQAFASMEEPGGTRHHELARFLARQGHKVSIIASPVSYLTGEIQEGNRIEEEFGGLIKIYRSYTYSALHKSFIHRVISFFSFMISSFLRVFQLRMLTLFGELPRQFFSLQAPG